MLTTPTANSRSESNSASLHQTQSGSVHLRTRIGEGRVLGRRRSRPRRAVRNHALQGSTYAILTSVGHAEIYNPLGQTIAKATADEPGNLLFATIDPSRFSNTASDPNGEFSWGVLNLIRDNYPGPRVADTDHGTKNIIKVPR